MRLEGEALTLASSSEATVAIHVPDLIGFTVVEKSPIAEGRASATTPDAELVVGWRDGGRVRSTRVEIPREALQVQLFLARLAQVKPDADLRAVPKQDALRQIEPRSGRSHLVIIAVILAAALAGLLLFLVRG